MKNRTAIIVSIIIIITVVICTGCIIKYYHDNQSITSFSAVMCSARKFHTSQEGSFLEIVLDDDRHTVKKIAVKDESVIEKISASDIKDIIGANITSDIPKAVLKEKHINTDISSVNTLQLLITSNEFDEYFEIADVSFANIHSFVGKVLEETSSYMIVEPAEEEYERKMADKIKIEYGTGHSDYFYGTGRLLVVYYETEDMTTKGRMPIIKSDDISAQGFREFNLEIKPSSKKEKVLAVSEHMIYADTSTFTDMNKIDYNVYFYGIEDISVNADGRKMPLSEACANGVVSINGIISKAERDAEFGLISKLVYKDGGSIVYKYPEYTIIKYHTLYGNRDVYIGTSDMDIQIANK